MESGVCIMDITKITAALILIISIAFLVVAMLTTMLVSRKWKLIKGHVNLAMVAAIIMPLFDVLIFSFGTYAFTQMVSGRWNIPLIAAIFMLIYCVISVVNFRNDLILFFLLLILRLRLTFFLFTDRRIHAEWHIFRRNLIYSRLCFLLLLRIRHLRILNHLLHDRIRRTDLRMIEETEQHGKTDEQCAAQQCHIRNQISAPEFSDHAASLLSECVQTASVLFFETVTDPADRFDCDL